jgi:sec-independent protein translocase protein TatC
MLWFNEWLGVAADLRLSEWLWFALMMPVIFGLSFQTPLVMMFLHRVGIVTVQAFRSYRRIVYFLMCCVAVVFMPTVDPQSILLLWGPMCALYELGILLCIYQGEREQHIEEKSDSGELVEV